MPPELIEQKVSIGRDRYGRAVFMLRRKESGQWYWEIRTEPASQRDDGEILRGLTDDNVREMARALDVMR